MPGGPSHPEPAPIGGMQWEGALGDQPPATKEEQPGEVAPAKGYPGEGDPPPHSDVSTPVFNFRYQFAAQYSAPPSGCSLFPVRSWDNLTNPFCSILQAPTETPTERPPDTTTGKQDLGPQEEADQLGVQPTTQTQEWEVGPVYLLSPPVPTQYSVELTFSFQLHLVGRYPTHFDFLFSDQNVRALSAVAGERWLGGGDAGPGSTRSDHSG